MAIAAYNERMVEILAAIAVFVILVFAEFAARTTTLHAELTRKFVHMAVGTFVAFWPFFMTWRQIELLSLAFLVVILISVKFTLFHSIHTDSKRAVGEVLFAMVIGFLALISGSKWIFTASMLHLALGDGIAAVAGLTWGDANSYKVFGRTKSIAGTSAFLVASLVIMGVYVLFAPAPANFVTLLMVPLAAAATENLAVNGTDNLIMPLLVAVLLGGAV